MTQPRVPRYVRQAHPLERRQPTDRAWDDVLAVALAIGAFLAVYWLGDQMPAPSMPVDPRFWAGLP